MLNLQAKLIVAAILMAATCLGGTIDVSLPPPGSFNIQFTVANNDGFDITKITFDLSNTQSNSAGNPPLTNGGTFGESGPAGGTATPFSSGQFVFGYNFTSFNNGEQFLFNLDPDIATDGSYGAATEELLGTLVTVVTTGGTVQGTIQMMAGPAGAARFPGVSIESPVPEPTTYALMGAGLGLLALVRRRRA